MAFLYVDMSHSMYHAPVCFPDMFSWFSMSSLYHSTISLQINFFAVFEQAGSYDFICGACSFSFSWLIYVFYDV